MSEIKVTYGNLDQAIAELGSLATQARGYARLGARLSFSTGGAATQMQAAAREVERFARALATTIDASRQSLVAARLQFRSADARVARVAGSLGSRGKR